MMTKTTITTETVKRIPDAKLAKMAEVREQAKLDAAYYQKLVKDIDEKLLSELERRGTHIIETNGWRITRVQAQRVVTDYDAVLTELNVKQKKLVLKQIVDPKAVAAAVGAGLIDVAVVDRHSEIKLNAPYPSINKVG